MTRCQHLKVNGTQCGSPALRSKRFCYFHSRHQLKPAPESQFDFPVLEDANAIQVALMQVIRAIADNKIECKRAGLLLYALQTASYNLKRASLEPATEKVVRDTAALAQEVAPPSDPVDLLRAMRRTYMLMRDPNLLNRDRDIVARECAPPKSAAGAERPTPDAGERDAMMNFVSQITRPDTQQFPDSVSGAKS
jgi:hypothetical protein